MQNEWIDALVQQGYVILDELLPAGLVDALADDCRLAHANGALLPAQVGKARQHDPELRGDATLWIEADAEIPARASLHQHLDAVRLTLNRSLMLGLDHVEAHYAVYPPGARYARHRDRFRDDDARVISFTCYLNRDWTPADGGALRLYAPDPVDVLPLLGRCSLFRSDSIEHEVLPATRHRLSIAGWFRRRGAAPFG